MFLFSLFTVPGEVRWAARFSDLPIVSCRIPEGLRPETSEHVRDGDRVTAVVIAARGEQLVVDGEGAPAGRITWRGAKHGRAVPCAYEPATWRTVRGRFTHPTDDRTVVVGCGLRDLSFDGPTFTGQVVEHEACSMIVVGPGRFAWIEVPDFVHTVEVDSRG